MIEAKLSYVFPAYLRALALAVLNREADAVPLFHDALIDEGYERLARQFCSCVGYGADCWYRCDIPTYVSGTGDRWGLVEEFLARIESAHSEVLPFPEGDDWRRVRK